MSLANETSYSAGWDRVHAAKAPEDAARNAYLDRACGVYTTPEARAARARQATLANAKRNEKRRAKR